LGVVPAWAGVGELLVGAKQIDRYSRPVEPLFREAII